MSRSISLGVVGLLICFSLPSLLSAEKQPGLTFHLTFDRTVSEKPFSGRVFVMLSRKSSEPKSRINPISPEPVFAKDVKNWKPGEPLIVNHLSLSYPHSLADLAEGMWTIQAVMDFDRGYRRFNLAPGNAFSHAKKVRISRQREPIKLHLDQTVQDSSFRETERVKLVDIPSKLLSRFHEREMRLRAGVILPQSFTTSATRRYPVIYNIPGFSGTHHGALQAARRKPTEVAGEEFLYVVLDPSSRWGHHVFADSVNNGPCGQALIEELIPAIEKKFRGLGTPESRILTGHSSGGWSSLWLQVTYPKFFGGVWSTSPDSVDFRAFQAVNIYQARNMFRDNKGQSVPLVRRGSEVIVDFKSYSDMDTIIGHGGQLISFEAVFGPRGSDGRPMPLWDRKTGAINPRVAQTWKKFDIRLILEENWKKLSPDLRGKIHVYMGGEDTYYLDGATRLLKQSLQRLKSDAVIEIFPGRSHSLLDRKLRARIAREMAEHFRLSQKRTSAR